MVSILVAAVFAVTPFYRAPPLVHVTNNAPQVMRDRHPILRHRLRDNPGYFGGYYGDYYEPESYQPEPAYEEQPITPTVIYRPAPTLGVFENESKFPTYSGEIVIKGTPIGDGCVFKSVMTDDEINTCSRAARSASNLAR